MRAAMSFDSARYVLPSSNSITGYLRCPQALELVALAGAERSLHQLIVDPLLVEGLLDLPAGVAAELDPDVRAAMELDWHGDSVARLTGCRASPEGTRGWPAGCLPPAPGSPGIPPVSWIPALRRQR